MNWREKFGSLFGTIATVEFMDKVSLWCGYAAAIFTVICLMPTAITKWRSLYRDYVYYKKHFCPRRCGVRLPCVLCYVVRVPIAEAEESAKRQNRNASNDD